jgi:Polysaccharide lyase
MQIKHPKTQSLVRKLTLASACFSLIVSASATIIKQSNMNTAVIGSDWSLRDGSNVCSWNPAGDKTTVVKPFMKVWSAGQQSVRLEAPARNIQGTQPPQRNEFFMEASVDEPFFQWRVMEFDIHFGTECGVPMVGRENNLVQWHQNYNTWNNANVSPFATLQTVNNNGVLGVQMWARNDQSYWLGGSPTPPGGNHVTVFNMNVTKGIWYHLTIAVLPNPSGSGRIQVWLNGAQVTNWTGKLGYPGNFGGGSFLNHYGHKWGLYRYDTSWREVIYYDNMKWATTQSGGHVN